MLTHKDALELQECINQAINREGDYLVALEQALELVDTLVADTDPAKLPTIETARSVQAVGTNAHGDEVHPAFGMAGVVRREGTPRSLFQSDLKHSSTIVLFVHTATRKRDLNRDWVHPRQELIEIEMSQVQWGAFVSSIGGSGVPVTLRRTQEQVFIPQLPYEPRTAENRREVDEVVTKLFSGVQEALDELDALEDAKGGVKARRDARRKLRSAFTHAGANSRFAVDSLTEAAESVVNQAKADIETHVMLATQRNGIEPKVSFSTPELPSAKYPVLDEASETPAGE